MDTSIISIYENCENPSKYHRNAPPKRLVNRNRVKKTKLLKDLNRTRQSDIYSLNFSTRIINLTLLPPSSLFLQLRQTSICIIVSVNNLCNLTSFSASYNVEVDLVVLQSLHRKWGNSSIHYPVMTLLFIKRLNDTFEENAEKLMQEGKSQKEAYENKNRHYFFIPEEARWSVLSTAPENIGEKIDHVCKIIERENPDLDGVLTNTKYNDKRKYPDDKLRKLISHFNVGLLLPNGDRYFGERYSPYQTNSSVTNFAYRE